MSPDRLLLCARDKSDLPVPDSVPDTFPLLSAFTWLVPLLIGHLMMKADLWPTHKWGAGLRLTHILALLLSSLQGVYRLVLTILIMLYSDPLYFWIGALSLTFLFSFFLPPSWRERLCIKSLTVVLTMQIPCECWSVSANSWLHTKSETEYDKGAHE